MPAAPTLRIGHVDDSPIATACAMEEGIFAPNFRCKDVGFENELLGLVLDVCNFSYASIPLEWKEVGEFRNGSYTKAMGQLVNGSLDLMNTRHSVTETRLKFFDFGLFNYQMKLAFVVRKVQPNSLLDDAFRLFAGFRYQLYAAFAVVALVIVGLSMLVNYCFPKTDPKQKRDILTYTFPDKISRKMAIILMAIVIFISTNLYQNVLLTQLFQKPTQKPFTFDTLISKLKSKELSLITLYEGDFFQENILRANDSYYSQLREALEDNPMKYVKDLNRALDMVETGRYVIRSTAIFGPYLLRDRCNLAVIPMEEFATTWLTFMMTKHSQSYRRQFTKCHMDVAGFEEHSKNRFIRQSVVKHDAYCAKDRSMFEVNSLSLNNLLGNFIILAIGTTVAVFALCCERINKKRKEKISELLSPADNITDGSLNLCDAILSNVVEFGLSSDCPVEIRTITDVNGE